MCPPLHSASPVLLLEWNTTCVHLYTLPPQYYCWNGTLHVSTSTHCHPSITAGMEHYMCPPLHTATPVLLLEWNTTCVHLYTLQPQYYCWNGTLHVSTSVLCPPSITAGMEHYMCPPLYYAPPVLLLEWNTTCVHLCTMPPQYYC